MASMQPQASTSTAGYPATANHHLATFVFDAGMPREAFSRVVEADGVVHRLVQRLMEKHGGEEKLRLSILITTSGRKRPAAPYRSEYAKPSIFLTSLPKIAQRFFNGGSGMRRDTGLGLLAGKKRKRREEGRIYEGVERGFKALVMSQAGAVPRSPPNTLISLTPTSAEPLLSSIYRRSAVTSPKQKYLMIVAGGPRRRRKKNPAASALAPLDEDFVKLDWDDLGERMKRKGIKCSSLLIEGVEEDASTGRGWIDALHEKMSDQTEEPWFDVPSNFAVQLTGFSVDEAPSPSAIQASTVGTDHLVTPQSNPLDIATPSNIPHPNPAVQKQQQQQQQQQQAMRLLQMVAGSSNKGTITPNMLQTLLQQTKNGNLDPNGLPLQQIRNLLQQQSARQANSQGVQSNTPTGNININMMNPGIMAQAAVLQQQRQALAGGSMAGAGQTMTGSGNVPAPQARQQYPKIWQGNIVWQPINSPQFALPVDAFGISSAGSLDHQSSIWGPELRITGTLTISPAEIQAYAKGNNTPCFLLSAMNPATDGTNYKSYQMLASNLHAKGLMAMVAMDSPGRGLALFAGIGPSVNGEKTMRLMGVVCLNIPFPTPVNRSINPAQQQPMQYPQQPVQQRQQPLPPQPILHPQINLSNMPGVQDQNQQQQNPPLTQMGYAQNGGKDQLDSLMQQQAYGYQQQQQHQQQQQQQQHPSANILTQAQTQMNYHPAISQSQPQPSTQYQSLPQFKYSNPNPLPLPGTFYGPILDDFNQRVRMAGVNLGEGFNPNGMTTESVEKIYSYFHAKLGGA